MSEFVEVKTADLVGAALDWAVAKVEGDKRLQTTRRQFGLNVPVRVVPNYSTHWNHIGPLIEKFRVSIIYSDETCDPCAWTDSTAPWHGSTSLVAACRAIVASVLGETVSVPKELLS
ncbi:DUF2591 domain-containing protein [Pseudomonas viridiflava]|uniref:phage protein NinX family protein n=1 Tax=Pseudomonas viridiflava TaxID=33069 RepID=UPI001C2D953A|nr:phage protein NinX family protein [Pseudomonas viridiflava]MBV1814503.1 DUF2591 domain-containing protein [Pseudomonas viridiflava]